MTFLFYWWSQHWLLAGRVTWRALLHGAFAVGLLTTVMFRITRWVMPSQLSWPVEAYGLIGAVFVLSIWLMILSVVIFGGTLYGALVTERRAQRAAAAAGPDDAIRSPLTAAGLDSASDASSPEELSSSR